MKSVRKPTEFNARFVTTRKFESPNDLRFLDDQSILIDGSNVIQESKHYGWIVLRTLFNCLDRQKSVDVDEAEAAKWYRMVAVQGHGAAQRKLDEVVGDEVCQDGCTNEQRRR